MAGQHGDQSVARLGIERDRAQQRASPEPPDETRAVELVISLRDRAGVSDSFGKGSADDFRRKLRAAEREQNAAAGERIDERPCVAYRDYARRMALASVSDRPRADPFAVNHGVAQTASRRRVRSHCQVEQLLPVALGFAQRGLGRDEAEVSSGVYDVAHPAVTVTVEE